MTPRIAIPAAAALGALLCGGACRAGPEPETLFAEAEQLRLECRKAASEQAIAKYRLAMPGFVRRGDSGGAARAAQRIGATFGQLGLLHESQRGYLEALPLARRAGDDRLASEVLSDLGTVQALLADRDELYEQAHARCDAALEMSRRFGGAREEAKALSCLGDVAYYRQRPKEALDSYGLAQKLWERLRDERGLAEILRLRGAVHSDLFELDEAQVCYERALALSAAAADARERAIALILGARLQERRGEFQKALNDYAAALDLLEPMGDAVWEASGLTGMATVYRDMGEAGASVPYWERALRLFEAAGLENVAVDVLFSLGATYLAAGDHDEAMARFERALARAEALGIPRWKALALRYIGVVRLFRRQPGPALESLEQSLKIQDSLHDPSTRSRTLADLGEAYALLGEHGRAVEELTRALALSAGDRVTRARALFGLARASMGARDLDAARRYVERSLEVVESIRTEVDSRDLRASYFASVHRYHEVHVDVLMGLYRRDRRPALVAAAFEASEQARARSLLDSLTEAGVDLRTGVDPELLTRERAAKAAFDDWARRHERPETGQGAEAAAAAEEYRNLERRHDRIEAEIRSKSPRYAALTRPQPLGVRQVQREVLGADTLLLEYALGDERSYLWAVSDRDQVSYELPPREEIESAARRAYDLLTARVTPTGSDRARRVESADADYWREARHLSETLLGPVARRMAGKRLLVVADGVLQYLPFAALPLPGRTGNLVPVVVEHEVVTLPSASVVAVLRQETRGRKPPAKAVAVLADPVFERDDPRLPAVGPDERPGRKPGAPAGGRATRWGYPRLAATAQEANAIVRLAPEGGALRALGFDASRATAMSPELAQYRIVHFATHGVFDNETPGLSGVVLSMFGERGQPQDGVLRLHDIYGLHLPAELVVLSACSTALGKPVRGEGLVGIVRGFMYAGAKRVVASLWKVDDDATGEMMGRFYEEMLEGNRSPAAALREAQIGMWRQERWRPPYYWAAFVLQGEWR